MNVLELFSGTHSIGNIFETNGWNIISVDLDNKFKPTHNIDILEFDYKQYPQDYFTYIHSSPPCILFSQNQQTWYGREKKHNITGEMVIWDRKQHEECIKLSDMLVEKTLEIINYFKPKYFTIENPHHNNWNNIKYRPYMLEIPYSLVDYCMYDFPAKKPTIVFNNFNLVLKTCDKSHTHIKFANFNIKNGEHRLYTRYVIPKKLCEEIFNQINFIENKLVC